MSVIRQLVHTGPSANRVDIVFMGDGYTSGEIETRYSAQISSFLAYMFDGSLVTEPFGRYRSFFNVYAIEVISRESGADHPEWGVYRDTALGATYRYDGVTDHLLYVNESLARNVERQALNGTDIGAEMRFIVVNDSADGGGGGYYGVFAGANSASNDTALHEIGHSFAGLADEYGGRGPYHRWWEPAEPNATMDPTGAKWAHWIGYDQPGIGVIGAYEGARYYDSNIYRPSYDSKMRSLGRPFDAVAREQFIRAFYRLVDPIDAHTPNDEDRINPGSLRVDVIDSDIIHVDWSVGGRSFADSGEVLEFDFDDFGFGTYTVKARAYDPTDWVRGDRSDLEQTVTWKVINNFRLNGGVLNDTLTGNELANLIEGRGGDDHMFGAGGRDTLGGGVGADRLDGGAGNDWLDGGSENDILIGGAGADTLEGGAGDDTYVTDGLDRLVELAGGGIDTVVSSADFALGEEFEHLMLTGAARSGTGNALANRIVGTAGANMLDGGGGADTLEGGAGDDTYVVDMTADAVIEEAQEGIDTVVSAVDYALGAHLEALILTGEARNGTGNESDNRLVGNAFANTLFGGEGNDTLDGRAAADTLAGGAGNDHYVIDDAGDLIVEEAGLGYDTAVALVSYALQSGVSVEILEAHAGSTAINLVGNAFANTLIGNAGANRLSGGIGSDRLRGGLGKDALFGGTGNDWLTGGRGKDKLAGGTGKDRFVFDDRDTGASRKSADYILDFRGKAGDRINLRLVDADSGARGDQAFTFIGTAAFTEVGQVRYEKVGSYTYVYLNTDADAQAEAVIRLKGAMDLTKGYFML